MTSEVTETITIKGVSYEKKTRTLIDCVFCRIVQGNFPNTPLLYKDEHCVVFRPRKPSAQPHFLVVPVQHVKNVTSLTHEHLSLLEHMNKVGLETLRKAKCNNSSLPCTHSLRSLCSSSNQNDLSTVHYSSASGAQAQVSSNNEDKDFNLCFHLPPYHSIDHLHLHAILKPYRSVRDCIKFDPQWKRSILLSTVLRNIRLSSPVDK